MWEFWCWGYTNGGKRRAGRWCRDPLARTLTGRVVWHEDGARRRKKEEGRGRAGALSSVGAYGLTHFLSAISSLKRFPLKYIGCRLSVRVVVKIDVVALGVGTQGRSETRLEEKRERRAVRVSRRPALHGPDYALSYTYLSRNFPKTNCCSKLFKLHLNIKLCEESEWCRRRSSHSRPSSRIRKSNPSILFSHLLNSPHVCIDPYECMRAY